VFCYHRDKNHRLAGQDDADSVNEQYCFDTPASRRNRNCATRHAFSHVCIVFNLKCDDVGPSTAIASIPEEGRESPVALE